MCEDFIVAVICKAGYRVGRIFQGVPNLLFSFYWGNQISSQNCTILGHQMCRLYEGAFGFRTWSKRSKTEKDRTLVEILDTLVFHHFSPGWITLRFSARIGYLQRALYQSTTAVGANASIARFIRISKFVRFLRYNTPLQSDQAHQLLLCICIINGGKELISDIFPFTTSSMKIRGGVSYISPSYISACISKAREGSF